MFKEVIIQYYLPLVWFSLYECMTCNPGGGVHFHMLEVRGCAARQGVLFVYMCSLRVYVFANFSCLCYLRYAFQPPSKLCVPSGYTISRFFDRILMFAQDQGQVVRAAQPRQSWYLAFETINNVHRNI